MTQTRIKNNLCLLTDSPATLCSFIFKSAEPLETFSTQHLDSNCWVLRTNSCKKYNKKMEVEKDLNRIAKLAEDKEQENLG